MPERKNHKIRSGIIKNKYGAVVDNKEQLAAQQYFKAYNKYTAARIRNIIQDETVNIIKDHDLKILMSAQGENQVWEIYNAMRLIFSTKPAKSKNLIPQLKHIFCVHDSKKVKPRVFNLLCQAVNSVKGINHIELKHYVKLARAEAKEIIQKHKIAEAIYSEENVKIPERYKKMTKDEAINIYCDSEELQYAQKLVEIYLANFPSEQRSISHPGGVSAE